MPIEPVTPQVSSYMTNAQFAYLGRYGRHLTDNPIHSTCQHATINQCHSCSDTITKFLKISGD